jgi:hypothetical protein
MAEKIVIEAEVKSNIGAVGKDASSAAGEFRVMGVSLNGVKAAFGKIIPMAKAMFGTIKAGIISTGIGALLIAVVSLFSYFKNTQRGAEMLERAMAGLGAIVSVVTDLFSSVGETIVGAFTDPKQAIKDLWEFIKTNLMNRLTGLVDGFKAAGKLIQSALRFDWEGVKEGALEYGQALIQVGTGMDVEQQKAFLDGIKKIGTEMKNEADAAMRLKGVMQDIRREEMQFSKVQAKIRQDVAKARLLAMDESKTQEERLEAINSVMEKELKMTAGIIEMQKKKIAAKKEENSLGESMIEDKEELMALEVELINLTTASTMTQKRLMTEVETLTLEMIAKNKTEEKARIKSKKQDDEALAKYNLTRLKEETDEAFKIRIDAAKEEQKLAIESAKVLAELSKENLLAEIDNLKERALKKLEIEHNAKLKELEGHENFLEIKEELDKKYAREEEKIIKASAKTQEQVTIANVNAQLTAFAGLAGALQSLAGESKELAIAEAIISTFVGANKAFQVGGPAGFATGAAIIVAGMANVKKIMETDVGDGGGGGGAELVEASTPAPQMMSGAFTLSGGQAPEPIQAYVVTDDMTNNQNKLANIRRRATI